MAREVYVNGRFLVQPLTGAQRYARELFRAVSALAEFPGDLIWHLVVPAAGGDASWSLPEWVRSWHVLRVGHMTHAWWDQRVFARFCGRGRLTVSPVNLLPLRPGWHVLCLHDLVARDYPGALRWWARLFYWWNHHNARRIAVLWTVSEFTRRRIHLRMGLPVESIAVFPPGGDHIVSVSADESVVVRLPFRRFFLVVGAGVPHRRVDTVLRAVEAIRRDFPDVGLVCIGGVNTRLYQVPVHVRAMQEGRLPRWVAWLPSVSDAQLRALYEHAVALVIPSEYEGFGIPAVEAGWCQCPVVTTGVGGLRESAPECPTFPVGDWNTLRNILFRFLRDPLWRSECAIRHHRYVQRFTWARTARAWLEWFMHIAEEFQNLPAAR